MKKMEENYKTNLQNGYKETNNSICEIKTNTHLWYENVTVINLCGRNLKDLDHVTKLPACLSELNVSGNKFAIVPELIMKLEKIKILNLSQNNIEYFDDLPRFYSSLEHLDLSKNKLKGPPYWVWAASPHNLYRLNLSCNPNITNSFVNGYFENLLKYSNQVNDIDLHNCRLNKFLQILSTFSDAKSICLGTDNLSSYDSNSLIEAPCAALTKCCYMERLNLCSTSLYIINSDIGSFKNLVEINLSLNHIREIPKEFFNLHNLETCVLSHNIIEQLPCDIVKLMKLTRLYLNSNKLCLLPENLHYLIHLKILDLYDNMLNELPKIQKSIEELDLALNFFEEPDNAEYLNKKEKLRSVQHGRFNGRKPEETFEEEISFETENECNEICEIISETCEESFLNPHSEVPSSPENWDSDDYWVPPTNGLVERGYLSQPKDIWLRFIKQKMEEGTFCPIDAHVIPIAELVEYERFHNPQEDPVIEGQFDDCSSDDS